MLPPQLKPAHHAGHAEQGKPRTQRGPFGFGIRGEIGPGRQVRREEQALEDVQVALVSVIEDSVPAVYHIIHPVVLEYGQHGRRQQQTGKSHPNEGLQGEKQKILEGDPKAPAEKPQEEIDQGKGYLAHKEVVVHETAGKHRESKDSPATVGDVFVYGGQEQREEDNGLMEMVKKDIINGKPGKSIEHCADQGGVRRFCVSVQVYIASKAGTGEFQNEQGAH